MIRRLVLSRRAESDLRGIWLYTFTTWGEAQADRYLDELKVGLEACQAAPDRGKRRDELRPRYWSRLIRRHVAFYPFGDTEVRIQRVLHGSMDPDLHMEEEEPRT